MPPEGDFMMLRMVVAALVISPVFGAAAHAADFDRTLAVSSAVDLYVATGSGRIQIVPGSDTEVHIRAHVYAGSNFGGDVNARVAAIAANPPIRQSGNSIHVGDVDPDERAKYNNISIDYQITAPRSVAMNLRSGSGDVEVDNLGRYLKAESGSGSVRAHGLRGPAELHSGSGDIELQETGSGNVQAATGSGSIRIQGLNGGLVARTGSGDIEAGGQLTGPAKLQTGSGSIRLHLGPSAHYNLEASTGSGDIRVPGHDQPDAHHLSMPVNGGGPSLEAHTGSGDIEVN